MNPNRKPTTRLALLTALGLLVSAVAFASTASAVYKCDRTAPWDNLAYTCVGTYGSCVVWWKDDDANKNPTDANATVDSQICA